MGLVLFQTVRWECDFCDAKVTQYEGPVASGEEFIAPRLPYGWASMRHKFVCGKHRILVGETPVGST